MSLGADRGDDAAADDEAAQSAMTVLRRVSQMVAWAAIATVGVLLVLETTDVIGGQWRHDVAEAVAEVANPTWPEWASALIGLALAVLGVLLIAAQLAPPRRGLTRMLEVHSTDNGETIIRGRAALRAVRHIVSAIEGIIDVDARLIGEKKVQVEIKVDDRTDLEDLETHVRERLDSPFWIDLGLADLAVNLLITHHPRPPRVR